MADDKSPRKPGPLTILREARDRQQSGPQPRQVPPANLGAAKGAIEAGAVPDGGKPSVHEAVTPLVQEPGAGVHERVTVKPKTIQLGHDAVLRTKDMTLEERVELLERRLTGYQGMIETAEALLAEVESLRNDFTAQEQARLEIAEKVAKPFAQLDEGATKVDPDAIRLLHKTVKGAMALLEENLTIMKATTSAYNRFQHEYGDALKGEVARMKAEIEGMKTGLGLGQEAKPPEQQGFFARLFGKK